MVPKIGQMMAVTLAVLLMCNLYLVDATYRKPPFNGSIFGKRASQAVSEYEQAANANKALSSLCEVVAESCATWFPNAESNI